MLWDGEDFESRGFEGVQALADFMIKFQEKNQ